MHSNWNLMMNVLLLIGVIAIIVRLMKSRHRSLQLNDYQPSPGAGNAKMEDDIICVRKIDAKHPDEAGDKLQGSAEIRPRLSVQNAEMKTLRETYGLATEPSVSLRRTAAEAAPVYREAEASEAAQDSGRSDVEKGARPPLMLFLLAKDNRQFAGYELLQTLLAAGLRFGEGQLFHRHQFPNGQGPVLCSLAAATESGTFDLQNIGGFSVRGLCLFMQTSANPSIDGERFAVILDTARLLSEELDGHLLDDQRKPLTNEGIARYHRLLALS